MSEGDEVKDPIRPLVFEDDSIKDSILDDILNEENECFLADIEMVGLLLLEFWGAKGQLKEVEGDVFIKEAERTSLTESENQVTREFCLKNP